MKYDKIAEYMNSISSSVSEMTGDGVKMSKEIGDTSVNIFVTTNHSGQYWFAGFISYTANEGYQREKIESSRIANTEEEIIKLIEITLSIATKLNSISEQYSEIKRLGKELTNIGILGVKNFRRR